MDPFEIVLPVGLVDELSAQATQIVADLFPIWAFVGGILLGLALLAWLVQLFNGLLGRAVIRSEARMEEMDAEFFGLDESTVVEDNLP